MDKILAVEMQFSRNLRINYALLIDVVSSKNATPCLIDNKYLLLLNKILMTCCS